MAQAAFARWRASISRVVRPRSFLAAAWSGGTSGGGGGTGGGTGGSNYVNQYSYTAIGSIHIYPNPAQTLIHIDAAIILKAVLSTVDGRKLMQVDNAKTLDVSSLPSGTYLLTLFDEYGLLLRAEKVIKTE